VEKLIVLAHPILTLILIFSYGFLAFRLFTRKELAPIDSTLAQVARISLLLTYLTGLVLSVNLRHNVHPWHHYASILPVGVIFVFQFLPGAFKKGITIKSYALMFLSMLITVLIISAMSNLFL